ncbi:MAG: ATP-dependent RNA helicase [Clostridia bacterium]|nr:ATP-dependent RNA helicase [Clostridia bacterium]
MQDYHVQPKNSINHTLETEAMRRIAEEIKGSLYPIAEAIQAILEAIKNNQVVAIVAETGAGKSTQVPIALLKAGYTYINITTPNRAAATTLSKRVSDELGVPHGEIAGYQTAFEKLFGPNTKILYSTEGLELIKQLCDEEGDPTKVLILDEIQEWGINTEALVGFLKFKIKNGFKTKVVLMSATMDENVAKFFDDAPVIRVPGRQYPIEERIGTDINAEIVKLVEAGCNTLAIVPGKYEISQHIRYLKSIHLDADIFPMHADLPLEEQEVVFLPTSRPKVVIATNVAQTSITIPDIDAVVDSGLERHMDIIDGLETLTIGNISRSDMLQRKGRAGRTKPGIYVWCGEVSRDELQEHSTPDIYTGSITQVVLRLASAGITASEIEFFHQPPIEKILEAQKTLQTLGAFDENNEITEIGKTMSLLPISVRYARMIVEAAKRDVLEDVVTIAAIQECGGIKLSNVPYGRFTKELSNDLLADLDCFNYLQKAIRASNWPLSIESNPFEGFNKRNYYRIMELRVKLCDVLYKLYDDIYSSGDRRQIAMSCAAGLVEYLYIRENNGWYTATNDPSRRKIDRASCTLLAQKMILGIPKNISLYKRAAEAETQVLYLISNAMVVDMQMLLEVAPHLIHVEETRNCKPTENDYSISETIYFGDTILDSKEYQITDVEERRDMAASWLAENTFNPDEENDPKLNVVLKNNRQKFRTFNDARVFYGTILYEKARNSVPSFAKPKNYVMLQCRD